MLSAARRAAWSWSWTRTPPRRSPPLPDARDPGLNSAADFIHGRFTLSTGDGTTRIKHLRRNPACSAVHVDGDRIAVVANGTVEWIPRGHPEHDEIHRTWSETYESDPYGWGDCVVFFRIQPSSMWNFAFHPEEFPE